MELKNSRTMNALRKEINLQKEMYPEEETEFLIKRIVTKLIKSVPLATQMKKELIKEYKGDD